MNMASNSIKPIDSSSVHRITSGQVVVDLATACKELVENAFDAGATSVEIRLKDSGLESIEVIDDASGIAACDYDAIALKHHTSKLSTFADLESVGSFGFRGEALSSLCGLSSSVEIVTSTSSDAPLGTVLKLNRLGSVVDRSSKVARTRGTTVKVVGLFVPLPVRRQELVKHSKREFAKTLNLLSAYALVPASRGVKLIVVGVSKTGKRTVHIQTNGITSLAASASALWGPKIVETLKNVDLPLLVSEKGHLVEDVIDDSPMYLEGLISTPSSGRTSTDRQFFYVNSRPCSLPKIQKAVNDLYKTLDSLQSPIIVLNVRLPTDTYDVNLDPDKRKILLHHEPVLVEAISSALLCLLAPADRATYAISDDLSSASRPSSNFKTKQSTNSVLQLDISPTSHISTPSSFASSPPLAISSALVTSQYRASTSSPSDNVEQSSRIFPSPPPRSSFSSANTLDPSTIRSKPHALSVQSRLAHPISSTRPSTTTQSARLLHENPPRSSFSPDQARDAPHPSSDSHSDGPASPRPPEVALSPPAHNSFFTFDQADVVIAFAKSQADPAQCLIDTLPSRSEPDGLELDPASAEAFLERTVRKKDFLSMEVVGQYNLGFIIARKTSDSTDDLFIVDQHASDEKINFEDLQNNTVIQSQKLIRPRPLELGAAGAVLVSENLEVLRRNGFELAIGESSGIEEDESSLEKVYLCAQPVSKDTVFDFRDLEELLHIMQDRPSGQMIRCTKARRMFASRACRKSIMIGKSLTSAQMKKVLRNLSEIEQPWNCPHGRPTMRHLTSLGRFVPSTPRQGKSLDWSSV